MIFRSIPFILFFILGIFPSFFIPAAFAEDEPKIYNNEYILTFSEEYIADLRSELEFLNSYTDEEIYEALVSISGLDFKTEQELPIINGANFKEDKLDFYTLAALLQTGVLEAIDPNWEVSISATPNDPRYNELWGLNGAYGIQAPEAWDKSTGSSDVVVGVIDTGILPTHPDLSANMWVNAGEIAGNGIDDDGNGVVDDVYGYNAINNSGNQTDDHSHGTHCAGTIGARGNNSIGVVGVNWNVKLMGIKFLNSQGSGSTAGAIAAINYAVNMKNRGVNLKVLNNSWGGGGYSSALHNAIQVADGAGMLFVAAAGNSNVNNDTNPHYPSSYDFSRIIAVASIASNGARSSFSNYGSMSVDIGAPGSSILSTVTGNGYASYNGTSMATPHVAGMAALLWAYNPNLTVTEVRNAILDNGTYDARYNGLWVTQDRANLTASINSITPNLPPTLAVIDNQSSHSSNNSIVVPITANDPENGVLTCAAQILTAAGTSFWNFKNQYQPFCISANCSEGVLGANSKAIFGSSGQLFKLFSNNNLYRIDTVNPILIGTFAGAYNDPNLLLSPLGPPASGQVSASCTPNNVTINWQQGFVGTFGVRVTVTDPVNKTATREFSTTVSGNVPVVSDIDNVETTPNRTLDTAFNLAAGFPTATTQVQIVANYTLRANQLKQSLGFVSYYPNLNNRDGLGDKWIYGSTGWYYLLLFTKENGDKFTALYRNSDKSYVASFPERYYLNPELFISLEEDKTPMPTFSIVGSVIRSVIPQTYTGDLLIQLKATNTSGTSAKQFDFSVRNNKPQLSYTGFYSVRRNQAGNVLAPITITDQDGDTMTVEATASNAGDELISYVTNLNLHQKDGSYFYNSSGKKEYYLWSGKESRWYLFMPEDGYCVFKRQNVLATPFAYYPLFYCSESAITNTVLNHPRSNGGAPSVNLSSLGSGNYSLAINAADTALTRVKVIVSDGYDAVVRYIFVRVENSYPTVSALSDHVIEPNEQVIVPVTVNDADDDIVTYTVSAKSAVTIANDLKSQLGLTTHPNCGEGICQVSGKKLIFSTVNNSEIYLVTSGSRCLIQSLSGSILGEQLPLSYCQNPAKILVPNSSEAGSPTATLSQANTSNPKINFDPKGALHSLITFTATDSIQPVERSFYISVSNTKEFNQQAGTFISVLDSDGDGVSDNKELLDGTDPYDAGDFKLVFSSLAYGTWQHQRLANSNLIIRGEKASTGNIEVYGSGGELVKEIDFIVLEGETAKILLFEQTPDAEDTNGFLKVNIENGGEISGYIELTGYQLSSETARLLTRNNLFFASQNITHIPYEVGRYFEDGYECDIAECLADLYLTNLSLTSSANFKLEYLDPLTSEVIFSREITIDKGQTINGFSSDEIGELTSSGIFRVSPVNIYHPYHVYLEGYGGEENGSTVYNYLLQAASGTKKEKEYFLSNILEEESSLVTLTNPTKLSAMVLLRMLAPDKVYEAQVNVPADSRYEFDPMSRLPVGTIAKLIVRPLNDSAIITTIEHSYDDLTEGAEELKLMLRENQPALDIWDELKTRLQLAGGNNGSGELEDNFTVSPIIEKQTNKLWKVSFELKDSNGQVITEFGNFSWRLIRIIKGRKNRTVSESSSNDFVEGIRKGVYRVSIDLPDIEEKISSKKFTLKNDTCNKRKKKKGLC